jgi:hypothetical protein
MQDSVNYASKLCQIERFEKEASLKKPVDVLESGCHQQLALSLPELYSGGQNMRIHEHTDTQSSSHISACVVALSAFVYSHAART